MLPDSLDPDQDLQFGSKLFTWYDVCCNIRGGISSEGDYVLLVKFMGGILSTYTKMSRGGFCPGGIMSVSPCKLMANWYEMTCSV